MSTSLVADVAIVIGVCVLVVLRLASTPEPTAPAVDERDRDAAVARALMHGMLL